jgi:hypothetical protein
MRPGWDHESERSELLLLIWSTWSLTGGATRLIPGDEVRKAFIQTMRISAIPQIVGGANHFWTPINNDMYQNTYGRRVFHMVRYVSHQVRNDRPVVALCSTCRTFQYHKDGSRVYKQCILARVLIFEMMRACNVPIKIFHRAKTTAYWQAADHVDWS